MLTLVSKKSLPNNKKIITIPWDVYFNTHKITKYFDKSDEKIIHDIEHTDLLNSETIHGKFSDMPIGVGCLSEGCKTLLCINHAIKTQTIGDYIFNITSCGGNAVSYLASVMAMDNDVTAYINHYDFGTSQECFIKIGEKTFNDAIDAASELLRLQGDNCYV